MPLVAHGQVNFFKKDGIKLLNTRAFRYKIILALLILVVGITGGYVVWNFTGGYFDAENYKKKVKAVSSGELPENPIDFAALQEKNPDIYAWIYIPNTNIEYPVVQSREQDDTYYLNHNAYREKTSAGAIFSEKLNSKDFTDPNTVLYGHNMKNGTMFRTLRNFMKKDFFDANPNMYIYTPGHILTYEIFSVYRYDDRHILNSFNFSDKTVYAEYLEYATNPTSVIRNVREGVEVTADDTILTLSTCMNNGKNRLLVQGVLTNDQLTK